MGTIDFDPALARDAERVVQTVRGMGKINVEVLGNEITVWVLSRAVKKQVEELLATLDLQSPWSVYLRQTIPHPPTGPERHFPSGVRSPFPKSSQGEEESP